MNMNVIAMLAALINLVSAYSNYRDFKKRLKEFEPVMFVDNRGNGPQIMSKFTELPPVGTIFYIRRQQVTKTV